MAKITSIIYASQLALNTEELIKNSDLEELKNFIISNGEVEEDEDEKSYILPKGENKGIFGKTYQMNKEFGQDEFFISDEGRIFFVISPNKQVEIIDEEVIEAPAGMKLVKVDRNGSKHYEGQVECPKCGGIGLIAHHVENGVPSWNWTDGGVCWKCLGSGKVHGKVIIRTPEYQAKLDAKRKAKEEAKKAEHEAKIAGIRKEWLVKNGWTEDGFTFLFLGNTYERKDEIKELGGRFNRLVGWYIDHEVEGFEFLKISKDVILFETYWGYDWKYDVDINSMKKAEEARLHPSVHVSEFQGKVKDRMKNLNLTLMFTTTFENQRPAKYRGWHDDTKWFYSFKDDSGNIFTWTASLPAGIDAVDSEGMDYFKSIKVGDKVVLDGTVKDHKEYKGDKQTVLTRCKVQKIA